jgi:hypothetical protein
MAISKRRAIELQSFGAGYRVFETKAETARTRGDSFVSSKLS